MLCILHLQDYKESDCETSGITELDLIPHLLVFARAPIHLIKSTFSNFVHRVIVENSPDLVSPNASVITPVPVRLNLADSERVPAWWFWVIGYALPPSVEHNKMRESLRNVSFQTLLHFKDKFYEPTMSNCQSYSGCREEWYLRHVQGMKQCDRGSRSACLSFVSFRERFIGLKRID